MAKSKAGSAPRVVVVAQRKAAKPPSKGGNGRWTKIGKLCAALFGVGVLSYAARLLFPQSSPLGRFITTGIAGVALAAAFGTFKGTRNFATNYVLPAAIGMAALDAGATVMQDWGSNLAAKLTGGTTQAKLPAPKPTAPSGTQPNPADVYFAVNPPAQAQPQQQIVYQPAAPAAPKYTSAQANASIIAAAIAAAGDLGKAAIGAFSGSKGLADEMESVKGSGRVDVAATLFGS